MITQNYSKCHYLEPYSWLMTCFYIPSPCFMGNILKNNWTKSLRLWAFFNWWFIYLFVEQIHWWFRTYVCVCVYIYICKKDDWCYSNLKWSSKLVVRVSLFSFPQFDIINAKFLWNLALRVPNSLHLLNRLIFFFFFWQIPIETQILIKFS